MTDPTPIRRPLTPPADTPAALPKPRGYKPMPCPLCHGSGFAHLTYRGPRLCPTCAGGGVYAETWLTVGGMLGRARQFGLSQ